MILAPFSILYPTVFLIKKFGPLEIPSNDDHVTIGDFRNLAQGENDIFAADLIWRRANIF